MTTTVELDIVSLEEKIFSGAVEAVTVSGALGELTILPGHAPLITAIQPGQICITLFGGTRDIYYVSGGIVEVLPTVVTILADTVIHSDKLDEAAAIAARTEAKRALTEKQAHVDFTSALAQITQATAKLRTIRVARKKQ